MTFYKVKHRLAAGSIVRLPLIAFISILMVTTIAAAKQAQDDSPRELSGMSASISFNTKDDLALDLQSETAVSMLYRLRKASPATLDRFANYSRDVSLIEAQKETIDYRFWLFRHSATLKMIEKVPIVDAPNTSDSIQHFYRCTAEATDALGKPLRCTILTRVVPSQLPLQTELNEPIEFTGLLYCRALVSPIASVLAAPPKQPQKKTLVLIADRLAWFPNKTWHAKAESFVDKRMIALAKSGFDVSQLDPIKRRNGKPLGGGDSEAFFQMLATVAAQPAEQDNGAPVLPIKTIIARSAQNIGARVAITARCRDCTRVEVTDPDKRERYGIKHYYQLVLFPELKQSITLTENTDDGPVKAVYERFPITVCAIKLPTGVSPQDVEGEAVSVDGTFFRVWKYDAEINQRAKTSGTISPLIISQDFEVLVAPQWLSNLANWGLGAIAVGIAFLLAYRRVFGNQQRSSAESILDNLPDQLDVTGLD